MVSGALCPAVLLPPVLRADDVQELGKSTYAATCAACHGEDGGGVPDVSPPLRGSEWLGHSPSALIRIQLHGLAGPISVAGKSYDSAMPPNGQTLSDEELAAVLNYARRQWGEPGLPEITTTDVAKERAAHTERVEFWTAEQLGPPAGAAAAAAAGPTRVATGTTPDVPPADSETKSSEPWLWYALLGLPMIVFITGILRLKGS